LRVLIVVAIIISFLAGKNYQKTKTINLVENCVDIVIAKLGKKDIQEYYGHGALPNTLPHAEAYVTMLWASCFLDKYLE